MNLCSRESAGAPHHQQATLWATGDGCDDMLLSQAQQTAPIPSGVIASSACIGIVVRSEQLRRIAEGDEAFVGDPERVA